MGQNRVDGTAASIQAAQLEVGSYDASTGAFANGALPANAVRATPATTVQNLFAGIFGSSFAQTTVTKTATAGLHRGWAAAPRTCRWPSAPATSRVSAAASTAPAACPSSDPGPEHHRQHRLDVVPGRLDQQLEHRPVHAVRMRRPKTPPNVGVGTSISLNNGQITSVLKDVEDCVKRATTSSRSRSWSLRRNFNQSARIMGFATIIVDGVKDTGGQKGARCARHLRQVTGRPAAGSTAPAPSV